MCMSNILHQAFKLEGNGLLRSLITPVILYPDILFDVSKLNDILSNPMATDFRFTALWDTGATCSCIKPDIAQKLNITNNIVTYREVTGVNSKTETKPVYRIGALVLPNRVIFQGFHLVESNIASDADILIGMDLILQGDFAISNYGDKTTFCFSMPPHHNKIDLVERGEKVNQKFNKRTI